MKLSILALCLALGSCASVQTDGESLPPVRLPESAPEAPAEVPAEVRPEPAAGSTREVPQDAPAASTDGISQALAFQVGHRIFQDDDLFGPVDSAAAVGLEYSRVRADGLGFELGLLGSLGVDDGQDDPNVIGVAAELYGGVRKAFDLGRFRPYAGAGATVLLVDINDDSGPQVPDDQDASLGVYLHGGVLYPVSETTSVGVDLRYVGGTSLDLGPFSGDADYLQAMFVVSLGL